MRVRRRSIKILYFEISSGLLPSIHLLRFRCRTLLEVRWLFQHRHLHVVLLLSAPIRFVLHANIACIVRNSSCIKSENLKVVWLSCVNWRKVRTDHPITWCSRTGYQENVIDPYEEAITVSFESFTTRIFEFYICFILVSRLIFGGTLRVWRKSTTWAN